MDADSGQISAGGHITRKKGCSLAVKEAATARDKNVRFCNRRGCSGRIKYIQSTNVGALDKSKCSTFCSSSGNKKGGASNTRNSVMTGAKEFNLILKRKLSVQSDSSASTNILSGSSNASMNARPQKPSIPPSPSHFSVSKSIGSRPSKSSNLSRCTPRNLKSDSTPEVVRPSCSSVPTSIRKNVIKRGCPEKKISSSGSGRKNRAPSYIDEHVSTSTSGISISNSRCSSYTRRDTNASSSVRSRNSGKTNKGVRPSNQQNRQISSSSREPADMETPNNVFSSSSSSHSVSSTNVDNSSSLIPFSLEDLGIVNLRNLRTLHRYNLEGICEVFLALERIEQDVVLTHEQVLALEATLFRSDHFFYDQHRDMRLDIDNMSYEELLALEERMGSVSTALSEETLSKCIRRSIYEESSLAFGDTGSSEGKDDIKCSICQEEFETGDEVGTLIECGHGHHVTCVNQWLRLKNRCPICKASVAPSEPSSSL